MILTTKVDKQELLPIFCHIVQDIYQIIQCLIQIVLIYNFSEWEKIKQKE